MAWIIREAKPADADAISRLIGALGYTLGPDGVLERLALHADGTGKVLVAESEGVVAGFLSFHPIPLFHQQGGLGRITAMAIDPDHHRQGIGRLLVTSAEEVAAACGCLRMEVTSGDHREQDAHLFYQAQGYQVDCRRFIKDLAAGERT